MRLGLDTTPCRDYLAQHARQEPEPRERPGAVLGIPDPSSREGESCRPLGFFIPRSEEAYDSAGQGASTVIAGALTSFLVDTEKDRLPDGYVMAIPRGVGGC